MVNLARLLILSLASLAWAVAAEARDIQVPGERPTIQQGIDVAMAGDRVIVAAGTYAEHIDFSGKNIQVIGSGGAALTTIDGTGTGTVVTFQHGETRNAVLAGFTIVNGVGQERMFAITMGGNVWIHDASPTIRDNEIRKGQACEGSGIAVYGTGDPHIHHNRIRSNHAQAGCELDGGGVYVRSGATIEDNLIADNGAYGLYLAESNEGPDQADYIGRNLIRDNLGWGLWIVSPTRAIAFDNLITGNSTGLVVWAFWNRIDIVNNTVADNVGYDDVVVDQGQGVATLVNNIVRTSRAGRMMQCYESGTVHFQHNLFYSSNGAGFDSECDIESGGLVADDPRFVGGQGAHAYWLEADSPAIDAGNDKAVKRIRWDATGAPRIIGDHVDLGAYERR